MPGFSPPVVGVRWEVEGATESWAGGKSSLSEQCHGDGVESVSSWRMALKHFLMS